jgi:hypothetical protein
MVVNSLMAGRTNGQEVVQVIDSDSALGDNVVRVKDRFRKPEIANLAPLTVALKALFFEF